jgi:hypothetical protein
VHIKGLTLDTLREAMREKKLQEDRVARGQGINPRNKRRHYCAPGEMLAPGCQCVIDSFNDFPNKKFSVPALNVCNNFAQFVIELCGLPVVLPECAVGKEAGKRLARKLRHQRAHWPSDHSKEGIREWMRSW